MHHRAHLDVLKPVSGLQIGEPVGVLDVGVDHVLQLAEGLSHHVDVVNIQEHQLSVLIRILTFITTPFHLKENKQVETGWVLRWFIHWLEPHSLECYIKINLVGSGVDTGPGIENEEFVGLSISIHDGLEILLILFAALPVYSDHGLAAARHRRLALWVDP